MITIQNKWILKQAGFKPSAGYASAVWHLWVLWLTNINLSVVFNKIYHLKVKYGLIKEPSYERLQANLDTWYRENQKKHAEIIKLQEQLTTTTSFEDEANKYHDKYDMVVNSFIELMNQFRTEKNFVVSDKIRDILKSQGIEIKNKPN